MMTQEIVVICTGEVMLEDDSWTGGELMFKGYKHGVFQILSDGKITYGDDADNLSVGLQLYSKTRCIFKGYSFGGTEVIKIADFSPSVKALAHFKMSAFSIINGRRTNYLKFAFIGGDSLKKFLDGFQQVCDDHNLKNAFTDPVWIDLVTKAFQSASISRGSSIYSINDEILEKPKDSDGVLAASGDGGGGGATTTATTSTTVLCKFDDQKKKLMETLKYQYQSQYCEENIYKLCEEFLSIDSQLEKEDVGAGNSNFVLFISSSAGAVPIWKQKKSPDSETPVIWDYHVILVRVDLLTGEVLVYDMDTVLPMPCPIHQYISESFRPDTRLMEQYRQLFRIIPAQNYINYFSSDRRHMRRNENILGKGKEDERTKGGDGDGKGDDKGEDIEEGEVAWEWEWLGPPPPWPQIKGALAPPSEFHNLPTYIKLIKDKKISFSQEDGGDDMLGMVCDVNELFDWVYNLQSSLS